MIPLRDTLRSRTFPLVNWLIIGLNVAVFIFILSLGPKTVQTFIRYYGLVPGRLLAHVDIVNIETVFTSMFLHGGWLHLFSNMLALFIFGDNIEDRMGHIGYAFFYLICGVLAAAAQIIATPAMNGPMIGASGAISGVLAAYLVLYPRARILTLFLLIFLPWFIEVPAVIYIGFWFLTQLLSGFASVSSGAQALGGIAFWAHIGGFISGLVLVRFFARHRNL